MYNFYVLNLYLSELYITFWITRTLSEEKKKFVIKKKKKELRHKKVFHNSSKIPRPNLFIHLAFSGQVLCPPQYYASLLKNAEELRELKILFPLPW